MDNYSGVVTIGTKMDTKDIERELKNLSKELESYDKEAQKLLEQKAKFDVDVESYEKLQAKLEETKYEIEELRKLYHETGEPIDLINLQEAESYARNIEEQLKLQLDSYGKSKTKIQEINNLLAKNQLEQEGIKNNYQEVLGLLDQTQKKESARERRGAFFQDMEQTAHGFTKMGLALLGYRGIYGALTKATHSYLAANKETKEKMDYIWTALGNVIGPIIERVSNIILKLVGYINVFVRTISGGKIDLTKNMKKNEKSVNATTKAMKGLNQQMAQFDEATKLQDNRGLDSGTSVGNLGIDTETLEDINNFDLNPKWAEKIEGLAKLIRDNWDKVVKIAAEIGVVFGAAAVGAWASNIAIVLGAASPLAGIIGLITALGLLYAGLKLVANAPSWDEIKEQYNQLIDDLQNKGKEGPKIEEQKKTWAEENATPGQDTARATAQLKNYTGKLQSNTKAIKDHNKNVKEANFLEGAAYFFTRNNTFMIGQEREELIKSAQSTSDYVDRVNTMINAKNITIGQQQEYLDWLRDEIPALKDIRDSWGKNTQEYKAVDDLIKKMETSLDNYNITTEQAIAWQSQLAAESVKSATKIKDQVNSATTKVIDSINLINSTPLQPKTLEINTNDISSGAQKVGQSIAKAFSDAMAKLKLQMAFVQGVNNLTMSVQKVFTGLAGGGLINLPGPGVPIAPGVVGGERAPEGVIPFTDEQVMETLGESIGRHVVINANIVNSMNGRVISRELQKINNESTFQTNR